MAVPVLYAMVWARKENAPALIGPLADADVAA
jgi:hypothetical protein